MKTVSVNAILLCILGFIVLIKANPDLYADKHDGINILDVLANRKLLIPYIMCLLDKGRCSPEGRELKSNIKEAMENYCLNCTELQRRGSRTLIAYLINKATDYWEQVVAKYDPRRKYVKKYETELRGISA